MKRFVVALVLAITLFTGLTPAMAGEPNWVYTSRPAYPQGYYPVSQPVQQDRPILKKVLIGGALVGVGFLAGRLTAPKPYYQGYSAGYPHHHHSHHAHHHHGHHHHW